MPPICSSSLQTFFDFSCIKSFGKSSQRYAIIDHNVCFSTWSGSLQEHTDITPACDKHSLCTGALLIFQWPKLEHKSNTLYHCVSPWKQCLNKYFSLVKADWKRGVFTYLHKSSCLQMPWIHHSKDICILLGCLCIGLHRRYLDYLHTHQYLQGKFRLKYVLDRLPSCSATSLNHGKQTFNALVITIKLESL